jgi:hypothetical protein
MRYAASRLPRVSLAHTCESPSRKPPMPIRLLHLHSGNLFGGVETSLLACARLKEYCLELEHTFRAMLRGPVAERIGSRGRGALHALPNAQEKSLPRLHSILENLLNGE